MLILSSSPYQTSALDSSSHKKEKKHLIPPHGFATASKGHAFEGWRSMERWPGRFCRPQAVEPARLQMENGLYWMVCASHNRMRCGAVINTFWSPQLPSVLCCLVSSCRDAEIWDKMKVWWSPAFWKMGQRSREQLQGGSGGGEEKTGLTNISWRYVKHWLIGAFVVGEVWKITRQRLVNHLWQKRDSTFTVFQHQDETLPD